MRVGGVMRVDGDDDEVAARPSSSTARGSNQWTRNIPTGRALANFLG